VSGTTLGLVAISLLAGAACGGEQEDPPPQPAAAAASIPVGWSTLPAPPFYRFRGSAVWVETELANWGGESELGDDVHADGAAFGPATGGWRPLARGPLSARSGAAAVWTGEGVLIWGVGPRRRCRL
jgi:hypothetical protein